LMGKLPTFAPKATHGTKVSWMLGSSFPTAETWWTTRSRAEFHGRDHIKESHAHIYDSLWSYIYMIYMSMYISMPVSMSMSMYIYMYMYMHMEYIICNYIWLYMHVYMQTSPVNVLMLLP
jgi:ABC-type phosphate transport system permease subunit